MLFLFHSYVRISQKNIFHIFGADMRFICVLCVRCLFRSYVAIITFIIDSQIPACTHIYHVALRNCVYLPIGYLLKNSNKTFICKQLQKFLTKSQLLPYPHQETYCQAWWGTDYLTSACWSYLQVPPCKLYSGLHYLTIRAAYDLYLYQLNV